MIEEDGVYLPSKKIIYNDQGYKSFVYFDPDKSKEITEISRKIIKSVVEKYPHFFWSNIITEIEKEQKKGKRIFNDIDPYGEENWEI